MHFNLCYNFKIIIYYYFHNYLILFIKLNYKIKFLVRILLVDKLNKKFNNIFIKYILLKLKL